MRFFAFITIFSLGLVSFRAAEEKDAAVKSTAIMAVEETKCFLSTCCQLDDHLEKNERSPRFLLTAFQQRDARLQNSHFPCSQEVLPARKSAYPTSVKQLSGNMFFCLLLLFPKHYFW